MESESSHETHVESSDSPPPWAIELHSILLGRLTTIESTLQSLHERIAEQLTTFETEVDGQNCVPNNFAETSETIDSITATQPPTSDREYDDCLGIMLGSAFSADPELLKSMQWIRENVLSGDVPALSLVGQLLVFRCASSDRKPSLLKELGEAYYRCFPKTIDQSDPFENALAAWSNQQCETAGLPNSIALAHPGERFDASRHSPVERGGVEISEVLGWIVLRDGGRVYSKASVHTR